MHLRHRGFTLVELMVTVAIAAILTAVAIPSYRQYVLRANRVDATAALLRLASNQERFYLQNNTYASAAQLALAPPAGLGVTGTGTERSFYTVTLAPRGGSYVVGYTATATVIAAGLQRDDTDCVSFTVNERGDRTAVNSLGANTVATRDRCWR